MIRFLAAVSALSILACSVALAQPAPTDPFSQAAPSVLPVDKNAWVGAIIQYLAVPLLGLAIAAINKLRQKWASEGTKSDYELWLSRLINALDPLGSKVYHAIEGDLADAFKDGVVTEEEREHLIGHALVALQDFLGEGGIKAACKALGIPDPLGLASWLVSKLLERSIASKVGAALPTSSIGSRAPLGPPSVSDAAAGG